MVLPAAQRFGGSAAVMAGGQLHPSGVPFTAFSAESRWLLPGSDLGPGVPGCKEAETAACGSPEALLKSSMLHQTPNDEPNCHVSFPWRQAAPRLTFLSAQQQWLLEPGTQPPKQS